jgi:hypothetical protein
MRGNREQKAERKEREGTPRARVQKRPQRRELVLSRRKPIFT